jgi:hypothetical protein
MGSNPVRSTDLSPHAEVFLLAYLCSGCELGVLTCGGLWVRLNKYILPIERVFPSKPPLHKKCLMEA